MSVWEWLLMFCGSVFAGEGLQPDAVRARSWWCPGDGDRRTLGRPLQPRSRRVGHHFSSQLWPRRPAQVRCFCLYSTFCALFCCFTCPFFWTSALIMNAITTTLLHILFNRLSLCSKDKVQPWPPTTCSLYCGTLWPKHLARHQSKEAQVSSHHFKSTNINCLNKILKSHHRLPPSPSTFKKDAIEFSSSLMFQSE